jgi:hypothetical protein
MVPIVVGSPVRKLPPKVHDQDHSMLVGGTPPGIPAAHIPFAIPCTPILHHLFTCLLNMRRGKYGARCSDRVGRGALLEIVMGW